MSTFLIGYDLNKPGQDYSELIERLKRFGRWWHHLDSTWLVQTSLTTVQVRDELTKLIDKSDELLVIDITHRPRAWTGFNADGSAWLKNNI